MSHSPLHPRGLQRLAQAVARNPANPLDAQIAGSVRGVDPDCPHTSDTTHVCRNRDGEPVRWGQACWTSARNAATRSAARAELAQLECRILPKLPVCRTCGRPIPDSQPVKCFGLDGSRYHMGACFLAEEVPS